MPISELFGKLENTYTKVLRQVGHLVRTLFMNVLDNLQGNFSTVLEEVCEFQVKKR